MKWIFSTVIAAAIFLSLSAQAADFIWIEGEAAKSNSMTRHPWWYDKVKKDEFSGGNFISNWGDKPAEALYEFESPADKEYVFWVRANPQGTKLSYKLDDTDWQLIALDGNLDLINVAEDAKPDLRFISWTKVGNVKLTKGAHAIRFKMNSDNNNHGMLDCFTFTAEPFAPHGATKPGEKPPEVKVVVEANCWPFTPPKDEFSPDSLVDLRFLNEQVAGESGYVTRSKDGNDFVLGNGKPARFWALNTSVYGKKSADLDRHAKFLAKRGCNMVRFHGNLTLKAGNIADINKDERDQLWHCVAAMKKQGIYTTFSPYWAMSSNLKPAMGELDSAGGGNAGLLFFDKKLQEAYKSWMKQVLTEKNPLTGIPLAEDPALAILQLQNEDSLLFWTSQGIKGAAGTELRKQFAEFLTKKYGSLDKANAAWGTVAVDGDNFAENQAGLYIIWELTQHRGGDNQQKRCADQMQFMTETMYNFNKTMTDYIHNDLGCKVLINAATGAPPTMC